MNMDKKKVLIALVIVLLILLVVGACYFVYRRGYSQGYVRGRNDLLVEQKKQEEEALKKALEAANPFSERIEVNPFKEAYKNPFTQ
jgi:flagellar basal body-associated protein FliL